MMFEVGLRSQLTNTIIVIILQSKYSILHRNLGLSSNPIWLYIIVGGNAIRYNTYVIYVHVLLLVCIK